MLDRERVRRRFAVGDEWFHGAPLYQALARMVAGDDALLDLAAATRPGQQPPNMLFGAVHLIVLRNPGLPFARFFASVRGDDAEPPAGAVAEFTAFCAEHRDEIAQTLRTRLVQTNVPGRGAALRLAMATIAGRSERPLSLIEVGPSAGIQLRFDRWAVHTAGARFGPPDAPLVLTPQWRAPDPPPDLDALPSITQRVGVDLHPVDASDPDERAWQEALVWPDHRDRFVALRTALDAVAADPPEIIQGDAIELLPRLAAERLGAGEPVVVFHALVRIHVPRERLTAFDAAIDALGAQRRLFHVSLEPAPWESERRDGVVLRVSDSAGPDVEVAMVEGHGRWIEPLI